MELNIRAERGSVAELSEKLLRYQYGSSVVMPAVTTPEMTKNGKQTGNSFGVHHRLYKGHVIPTTPAKAA